MTSAAPDIAPPAETPTPRRGPGRPRDPQVERRLKRAALETLAEHGFSGLTLERICERAGAPRATFYRRWATPVEAVADAFNEDFGLQTLPNTGDVVGDLIELSRGMLALYNDPVMGPCMSFMIAESRARPHLFVKHADDFPRRRARTKVVLERALARGQIDAATDLDLIIDVLSGLAMNNYATGRPVTDQALDLVIRRLLGL